jgi:hypothetical protein
MYLVISVLPISMTSGELPPARVASNFWRWSFQFWYWNDHRPAWVILLELRVRRRDDVRPAGLRVDLEPYGQLVCLCMLHTCARRRRDDSERHGSECRNENSRSHPRLPEPSTRDPGADPLWPAGVRARVSAPIGLYQLATPGLLHTGPVLVK